MQKVTDSITKILANILIVLMAAMVLDVTWQVFTRFILRDPSSFTEELARFLLIWIGVLGAAYALKTKAHLGIDILTYKLKGVKKQVVDILVFSIIILFTFFVHDLPNRATGGIIHAGDTTGSDGYVFQCPCGNSWIHHIDGRDSQNKDPDEQQCTNFFHLFFSSN